MILNIKRKKEFSGFSKDEIKLLKKLNTPSKIQDFLNSIEINFEENGKETCRSPIKVLRTGKAHCMEAAMFAAAVLRFHGYPPLVMSFEAAHGDEDHVIAVYKKKNHWGAISKTNHAILRYREPVYKSLRELAMSYFHEYFLFADGKKTLRKYSNPVNLKMFDSSNWMSSEEELWYINDYLCKMPHNNILSRSQIKNLRRVDPIEIKAAKLLEFDDPRGEKGLP
ncbi:hypothetical protein J4466_03730 [Candidatus Pacearchaeota archaeon]|nr:hypothetical protein [Candidatus Pacearchaeota archaeon]